MSFVLVDRPHPHVSLVTLNRPERMNAMASDVMIPLRETLEEAIRARWEDRPARFTDRL